ncbi:MAG: lytic transglycosylase domain-containing protein [Nitrospinaceae bacterium]
MFLSKRHSTFFSAGLALVFLGHFTGKMPQYLTGVSPYHSAAIHFEDRVFRNIQKNREKEKLRLDRFLLETQKKRRQFEFRYRKRVKEKILEVLANYKTGLPYEYLNHIPEWIIVESRNYGYDPMFLTALIITESSFNNWAESHRGALGLMQILPTTGQALARETRLTWRGKPTLYDPETNIALGTYYLNKLLGRYGDLHLALEAYNWGPSKLDQVLKNGLKPTRYSEKVLEIYQMIRFEPI